MSRTVTTVNPATGEALRTYDAAGIDDVLAILGAVHTAQPGWAAVPVKQRADHLRAIGAQLRKQRDELAALMTAEMGNPVAEARAEVEKSATACDYYAENGPAALSPPTVDTGNQRSWSPTSPSAWSWPSCPGTSPTGRSRGSQPPTLVAGNTATSSTPPTSPAAPWPSRSCSVSRPASRHVPVHRRRRSRRQRHHRWPDRRRPGRGRRCQRRTGGQEEPAGARAARTRSSSWTMPISTSPSPRAIKSRFINSGQSCLAAKRFIVQRAVTDKFTRRFAAAVTDLKVGDPHRPHQCHRPHGSPDLVDGFERQVHASVQAGATVLTGGSRLDVAGAWFVPTVISDVTLEMPVMAEETFGRHPLWTGRQRMERRP